MIEDIAESDKLDGCPHPRKTLNIFGHKEAQSSILNAIKINKIHHAWLLCGPKGIGKATLAWKIARSLLISKSTSINDNDTEFSNKLEIPENNPIYKRTLALTEPKLHLLRKNWNLKTEKFSQNITIDDIRSLKKFFSLSSTDKGRRVVIIDSADDLQTASANALLKILEEPPVNTTILIISHNPSMLLPTIKSRCRLLKLKPLNSDDLQCGIHQALELESGIDDCILELAHGSVGNAIHLLNNNGLEIYKSLCTLFSTKSGLDRVKAIELASKATNKNSRQYFDILISMIVIFTNRLALFGAGAPPQNEAIENEFQVLQHLAPNLGSARIWCEHLQAILNSAVKANKLNIEPSSVILDLLLKLDQIAQKIQLTERN